MKFSGFQISNKRHNLSSITCRCRLKQFHRPSRYETPVCDIKKYDTSGICVQNCRVIMVFVCIHEPAQQSARMPREQLRSSHITQTSKQSNSRMRASPAHNCTLLARDGPALPLTHEHSSLFATRNVATSSKVATCLLQNNFTIFHFCP